ncbi:unnamed protein product [Cladocopium goreaui]|uniref:YHYH domain-containing protein n=1 Tax=Cladocopium goreaui TaxID=2562237 RepID=A0A9P1DMG5_9DINO|nr:unnamed protein product [Cladocopium goreaui]
MDLGADPRSLADDGLSPYTAAILREDPCGLLRGLDVNLRRRILRGDENAWAEVARSAAGKELPDIAAGALSRGLAIPQKMAEELLTYCFDADLPFLALRVLERVDGKRFLLPALERAPCLLWCLLVSAVADPLVFEFLDTTWTIEVKGSDLEVTADCAENTWCGFGFNKDMAQMDGSDVFTFGYHASADLVDCPTKGCGTTGCGCGCGCGTSRRLRQPENPYIPRARDLKVQLPKASAPGAPKGLEELGGVVGVAMNGVLFVHEHPEEGWTWLFDNCGGHGDTYGHYHYHAPPLCLLKSLGVPVPKNSSWWKFEGEKAWPKSGPEVQVGWALDGAPIMGPFKGGVRAEKKLLDECHGAIDETTGEYRYYLVPEAPYVPPCLRGALGKVENFRSSKEGQPCSLSGAQQVEISTVEDGKVCRLTSRERPCESSPTMAHALLVRAAAAEARLVAAEPLAVVAVELPPLPHAAVAVAAEQQPPRAAVAVAAGQQPPRAAVAVAAGQQPPRAAVAVAAGQQPPRAAVAVAAGQQPPRAAVAAEQQPPRAAVAVAAGQQPPRAAVAVAAGQQPPPADVEPLAAVEPHDLTSYSLTFEGGRMKASAKRALNTGDSTDYVLSADTPYYILMTVGSAVGNRPAYQVGYHGSSATQTLVCMSTLTMKGACKPPSEWSGAPSLAVIEADANDSKMPVLSGAITMALLWLVH